ncbi:hypothetical protein ANCCAN_02477 [Ancylostoma caninum]|uniref:Uncharacterized protein n=1 Tax=Ancylostoma caninum TaxID=29170 RepID=A0A368H404_ANCCA|nr:hypothetical protein ANCCAN_02477 [Ancylostoma caninum]
MIGLLLLPLILARPPNGTRRCLDGRSYIIDETADTTIDTGECCPGFSRSEFGHCVEEIIRHSFPKFAVPRFAAAMSLLLVVWILIGVFSLVIAYVTLSQRRRNALPAEDEVATGVEEETRSRLLEDAKAASRPNSVVI